MKYNGAQSLPEAFIISMRLVKISHSVDLPLIVDELFSKQNFVDCFRQAFIQPQLNFIRSENNLTLL